MHPHATVGATGGGVRLPDLPGQPGVPQRAHRGRTSPPGVEPDSGTSMIWRQSWTGSHSAAITAMASNRLFPGGSASLRGSAASPVTARSVSTSTLRHQAAIGSLRSEEVGPGFRPVSGDSCSRRLLIVWSLICRSIDSRRTVRPTSSRSRTLRRNSGDISLAYGPLLVAHGISGNQSNSTKAEKINSDNGSADHRVRDKIASIPTDPTRSHPSAAAFDTEPSNFHKYQGFTHGYQIAR